MSPAELAGGIGGTVIAGRPAAGPDRPGTIRNPPPDGPLITTAPPGPPGAPKITARPTPAFPLMAPLRLANPPLPGPLAGLPAVEHAASRPTTVRHVAARPSART